MSKRRQKQSTESGFRLVLFVGAVITIAIAVWGLVWTGMLHTILGFDVPKRAYGVTRLYGGVMLAVGVGYALAAAQPQRSRGLLVALFLVPLVTAFTTIVGVSRNEVQGGKGIAFAVFEFGYCLFYFRLYPRLDNPEAQSGQPPGPAPGTTPGSRPQP